MDNESDVMETGTFQYSHELENGKENKWKKSLALEIQVLPLLQVDLLRTNTKKIHASLAPVVQVG